MRKTKKIIAGIVSVSIALTCSTALAKWEFSGYDTSDWALYNNEFGKIYYEVDENGIPTNNEKIDGYAGKIEWVHDFYEKAFPHAGINRLYLDGVRTSVTADSGSIADWKTEYRPETWEVKYPYNVYERLWSKVENKTWTPNYEYPERGITNDDVYKYLGKNADVSSTYSYLGFGRYRVIDKDTVASSEYFPGKDLALRRWFGAKDIYGNYIVDVKDLYERMGIQVSDFPFDGDSALSSSISLSDKDENGNYIWDDASIASFITTYRSEFLTGPNYMTGGNKLVDSLTYYDELTDVTSSWYNPAANLDWFNPHLIMESDSPSEIAWSNVCYEKDFPYNYYQYLIVDGVLLDGSYVAPNVYLPRVFRYTGGQASPKVEWKYSFAEAAPPHKIYCEKFLDGKATEVLGFFEQRAGSFGIVVYGETKGELDYKLKSVYGVQDYELDDVDYKGYAAWVPLTDATADAITDATNAALKN